MKSLPPDQRTMLTPDVLGTKLEPIPGMGVCDFCTEIPVRWAYPCGLVVVETPIGTHASSDPWGACDPCHELIEAGDQEGLVQRALANFDGPVPAELAAMFHEVQAAFFAARLGDARPL